MEVTKDGSFASLVDVVVKNPASKKLINAALVGAQEQIDRADLVAQMNDLPTVCTCTQTPQTVISLLLKYGALDELITVDGDEYDGSSDDLKIDETISEDAEITFRVRTTQLGQQLIDHMEAKNAISQLLATRSSYADTFLAVMHYCDIEGGRSMKQIEDFLKQDPETLRVDPQTGFPAVYPAYFTTALEDAGAIVWSDVWTLTPGGKEYVALHGKCWLDN